MRITRYQMYKSIFGALELPLRGKILGISGLKYFIGSKNYIPPFRIIDESAEVTNAEFPAVNVCALPYEDNTYDYVICDQVLEHVEGNIQTAIDEMRRVLKPGGIAIISSVFMQEIHWGPKDLWRFSVEAFQYLCRDFNSIITVGSWGNRPAHILFLLHKKFKTKNVPERKFSFWHWLASKNDPGVPFTTWIVAKK